MFKQIDDVLSPQALAELNRIADRAPFVDGRVSNPHSTVKRNVQVSDPEAHNAASQIMANALMQNEEFRTFAFPKMIAPPLLTGYRQEMHYGPHTDTAFMQIGQRPMRADLSCTLFLSDPETYEGGHLRVQLGDFGLSIRCPAGSIIVYPSTTLHEVTPVTRGERRVGLTFIESRIPDPARRDLLYELNEIAALEGLSMNPDNFTRLQRVQMNLLRAWGEPT
jgi:PKHD-type hydroxylase